MSEIESKIRAELLQDLSQVLEHLELEGYVEEAVKLRSIVAEFAFKYVGPIKKTFFMLSRTSIPCIDNGPHDIAICDNTGSPFCFRCNYWVWYLLGKRYANFDGKREVRKI